MNKLDNGYHRIDTVFNTLNLHDTLTFEKSNESLIIESNVAELNNQDNLVWKAVEKIKPHLPKDRKGLKIILHKKVPMGAGLGGGSSNAATTLLGLNVYYKLNLSDEKLIGLASQLGADVPFFIKGGVARGEGIGDKLTYYTDLFYPLDLVIVYPKINASTKEAYEELSLSEKPITANRQNIFEILEGIKRRDINKICNSMYNRFEDTQFMKYPVLKAIKEDLMRNGALGALMSGSGSTVFGVFESKENAEKAIYKLAHNDHEIFLTESIPSYFKTS